MDVVLAVRNALLTGLVATLALVSAVDADSSLDAIRTRGLLRVGVKADAPPFGYVTPDGRRAGFEVDLARLFARVLFGDDTRVEFVTVTTATRFTALQTGRVDLVLATITATAERRQLAELSAPHFVSGSLLLVSRGSPVAGLGDLVGRRVAVVVGAVQERDLVESQPRAVAQPVDSVADGVRAVRSDQADAFLYDDVVLLRLAQEDSAFRVIGKPIRPRPYVVAAPSGEVELIHWVNRWLAKMRRDGTYDELWRRHFDAFASRLVKG
jgi:ABC-type amino acid transport substrate-binding protein